MADKVFIEENGFYQLDCRRSSWAVNELNSIYHDAKIELFEVLSIAEWNEHEAYSVFPLSEVESI